MVTLAQSWSGGAATGDRRNVEANRPHERSPGAWDFLVENASRLLRREDFRFKHAAVVRALELEGRLTYEQILELVTALPGRRTS
jgi:hypothetical protein